MVSRIFESLSRLCGVIAGVAATLMMLHILIGVILRVVFGVSLLGTIAIVSDFYMVIMVFLGVFVVSFQQEQIQVDVLVEQFPSSLRRITDTIAELVTLAFLTIFTIGLGSSALQKTMIHERVDAVFTYLTVWPLRWVAMIGLALAALVSLWHFSRLLINGRLPPVPGETNDETDSGEGRV